MSHLLKDGWGEEGLNRAGQVAFWDRQAPNYESADMTLDNEGELDLVRALSRQFSSGQYRAGDVVTLGGAVGSRDPKVVLEELQRHSQCPAKIYFNDLSVEMTLKAGASALASYRKQGIEVVELPGPIHEIAYKIPVMPRRVIVGVYRLEAFVKANPHYGYPLSGFEEYDKNAERIGSELIIEPIHISGGDCRVIANCRILSSADDSLEQKQNTRLVLTHCLNDTSINGLRIVGRDSKKEGFFLSHWFTESGVRRLVESSFDRERVSRMSVVSCAKGFVICIDPLEPPRGIVTVLNNVIGNVLPNEQVATLRAINILSR